MLGELRDADAHRDVPARDLCPGHGAADALGDARAFLEVPFGQDHEELFAPVARHEIHLTRLFPQRLRDGDEHLVARQVTEGVVVVLEVVDVHHQHGEGVLEPLRPLHFVRQDFPEAAAVEQAGQGIGSRPRLELSAE